MLNIPNEEWYQNKSLNNFLDLYKSAEKLKYEKGEFISLYKIERWYMFKGEYNKAIKYIDKIENLPMKNPANFKFKVLAMQDKSIAYINLGFYDDARAVIEKSIKESNKLTGDTLNLAKGKAYEYKATLYVDLKKKEDSVLFYLKKSLGYYLKIKNSKTKNDRLKPAYINISMSFFVLKKLDSSLYYSYKVLHNKNLEDEARSGIYVSLAQTHLAKNDLDSGLFYYKKAEVLAKKLRDPFILKDSYNSLSGIYEKLGNKDMSLFYTKKYASLVDSLARLDKKNAAVASQNIKKGVLNDSNNSKKKLYWIIGGVIVILFLITIFLLKFFKGYHYEKNVRLQKEEIISEKESELYQTKSKLNDAYEEIINLAKNNDPAFLARFKEVYPEFCSEILKIYPTIINSELIFCAYLKLNFSTKEIATYTHVGPKAVQNRKNRIRKKLNIPSDEDINIWLDKIG